MDKRKMEKVQTMNINWDQQKVLSNPLRARLVAYLYEKPMTPKQVADLVGKNPGTVYYHIQQLLKHDILEIDHVNTEKGIVEKFYKAKAMTFKNPEKVTPADHVDGRATSIYLSKELVTQLSEDLEDLFLKYGQLSHKEKDNKEQSPYSIEFLIKHSNEEEQK